jgi:hypothetical protein
MTETTTHEAAKDAEVLSGVLQEPKTETKTETAAPPRRNRRAASAPATAKAPAKGTAKTPAKAATGKAPAKPATGRRAATGTKAPAPAKATGKAPATPKAEQNGSAPTARDTNQVLAKELIDLVAGHFAGHSKDDQQKIANWLKVLPTGGRAHERYWPAKFTRPSTSDWRKPE